MSRLLLISFQESEVSACIGFGKKLNIPYDILTLSNNISSVDAEKCYLLSSKEPLFSDNFSHAIQELCKQYTHIASVSTMQSKDMIARLAGTLNIGMISDITDIIDTSTFKRPMVAGSIIATVQIQEFPICLTFRSSNFSCENISGHSVQENINIDLKSKIKRLSEAQSSGERPDLTQSNVVVSGGRPLKDRETFEKIIGGLADKLSGAVGATRAAVDSGIASNDLQVGQTGKIVAPELYIAAGISGSTQHMAGIKDSKIIVAINKDPDAPIFEMADIGIVGDLYDIIPELIEKINN